MVLWCQTLVLLRVDWKLSIRDAESSPTENSSLNKYTNLDPCCYGNLLMEFHHQSNLHSVACGHTHTLHLLADCSPTSPMVGYLLPFSQPSIFLSSHIIESPMGTLFLLPHHLSLFSLLLGEKGDRKKRNEHGGYVCTGEFIMDSLLISKPSPVFCGKSWKKEIKGAGVQRREQRLWVILTKHTHLLHPNLLLCCCFDSNLNLPQLFTFGRQQFLSGSLSDIETPMFVLYDEMRTSHLEATQNTELLNSFNCLHFTVEQKGQIDR